jgi:hypothetical protein
MIQYEGGIMYSSIDRIVRYKLVALVILGLLSVSGIGCEEAGAPVTEPEAGPEYREEEQVTAGELHNLIIREYFSVLLENGRLEETGGRIPWTEAKKVFLVAGNRVLEEQNAGFRLSKRMLEERMLELAGMKRKGIMDVFYPEKNPPFPAVLDNMADAGYISASRARDLAGYWNGEIAVRDEGRTVCFTADFRDDDIRSVIKHSSDFWSRTYGEDIVGKEEDEDSEDSFWDKVRDWWMRNRKDIRRITVTSCDAGGAVAGAGLGPPGVVAGSMLASTGATIAWPPYDDAALTNGGGLNCVRE